MNGLIIVVVTSILAVIASIGSTLNICNWRNMFYFETRCFSSITVRHNAGQFVENVSTIKKKLGAVSCTLAQFTNKVRKKLGSTQLSELRLGELSIRSGRFYEIKHADCGLRVNFWKFWLVPICFMILSKSYYFALRSPLKNINSWRIISIVTLLQIYLGQFCLHLS